MFVKNVFAEDIGSSYFFWGGVVEFLKKYGETYEKKPTTFLKKKKMEQNIKMKQTHGMDFSFRPWFI